MKTVWSAARRFVNDEQGQDLIEYTALLAFIALASALLLGSVSTSITTLWSTASTQLSAANAAS